MNSEGLRNALIGGAFFVAMFVANRLFIDTPVWLVDFAVLVAAICLVLLFTLVRWLLTPSRDARRGRAKP